MPGFTELTPYADPGSLMGGIREHRVVLNNLQADAYRTGNQAQTINQSAKAYSGADVDNDQEQDADIDQTAIAEASREVTINAVTATNPYASAFNFNYLQRYIAGVNAGEFLARGASDVVQSEGGSQVAYAELTDFDGVQSDAFNVLDQRGDVVQGLDVDLTATVTNTTLADDVGDAYNQARYRTIEADVSNQSAQAIFSNTQKQGTAANPVVQVAGANGAQAGNDRHQDLGINMPANSVDLVATFDLSRFESSTLSPRTTSLLVGMNEGDTGVSAAVNSSGAWQEQAHDQAVVGGKAESGEVTENGGIATNTGDAAVSNTEDTSVTNSITITI